MYQKRSKDAYGDSSAPKNKLDSEVVTNSSFQTFSRFYVHHHNERIVFGCTKGEFTSDQDPRNSSQWKARDLSLTLPLAFSTMLVTSRFCSVPPQPLGSGQGPTISLPLRPTQREDLLRKGYSDYPHATKAIYISNIHTFSVI
ncbi:hypothetical protein TNCV_1684751 [Trichonephila clavipes]|nr:hypothetical protein TNCV_1684751 [Trichonephila clavipes]